MTVPQIVSAWSRRQVARLWFVFLILVTCYMAGWYHMYGLLLLSMTGVLLLAAMAVLAWYLAAHLEVSVTLPKIWVRKGEQVWADILVQNTGVFPVSRMAVIIRYTGGAVGAKGHLQQWSGQEQEEQVFYGAVSARGQSVFRCPLPALYCGTVTVFLQQIRVSDYMNLFLQKRRFGIDHRKNQIRNSQAVLTILPSLPAASHIPARRLSA